MIESPGAVASDVGLSVETGHALSSRVSRCIGVCDSAIVLDGCSAVSGRVDGPCATDLAMSVVMSPASEVDSPNDATGTVLNG